MQADGNRRVLVRFRPKGRTEWEEMVVDHLGSDNGASWFSGRPVFGTVKLEESQCDFTWEYVPANTKIRRPRRAVWQ